MVQPAQPKGMQQPSTMRLWRFSTAVLTISRTMCQRYAVSAPPPLSGVRAVCPLRIRPIFQMVDGEIGISVLFQKPLGQDGLARAGCPAIR